LDYASKSSRLFHLLERVGRQSLECSCVEVGFVLPFVVRKRNDRSFEDCTRPVVELKLFYFITLYHWTATLDLSLPSFHVFLDLFILPS
jgi:hypothetical protein